MRTFGDYPNTLRVIMQMFAANTTLSVDEEELKRKTVPSAMWRATMLLAEHDVQAMAGNTLGDYVPTDMIDSDLASPRDDALEVMAVGDPQIKTLLLTWAGCNALDTVLESAFDGELHECLTSASGHRATA